MAEGLNSLLNRILMLSPPIDTLNTWRIVFPVSPGAGGLLCGSTNCGEQAQVPVHFKIAAGFSSACILLAEHELVMNTASKTDKIITTESLAKNELVFPMRFMMIKICNA